MPPSAGLAAATPNPSAQDAVARANELTGGQGFDYVIEAVGSNELVDQALDLIRNRQGYKISLDFSG